MATSDWKPLHKTYYRKRHVYDMRWDDIDLEKYVIAGAYYGGPIALVRDEHKILLVGYESSDLKPKMRIYTSAGTLISAFSWKNKGLVRMGWTDQDELICVLSDGNVFKYSVHGQLLTNFKIGQDIQIADCHMWPTGMALRTAGNVELWVVDSFADPHPRRFPNPGLDKPPSCMTVIDPSRSASRNIEIILGTAEGSILVVDERGVKDQMRTDGPFISISVAPSGGNLACFNSEGTVSVLSSDFQKTLTEFKTKSKLAPLDLVWCGDDSVVLYWDKMLLMVGPYGDYVKYPFASALHMVSETDGVRIITNDVCEFLQRVPESTEDIFKIGSVSSTAMLYDATEAYDAKSAKADDNTRAVKEKGELESAVMKCIDAAVHEFDPVTQRKLLRSAAFGKLFARNMDPNQFVDTCQILRVINAVRDPQVGIPITFQQFEKLGAEPLIDRLINRYHHMLALKVCEYLRIKPDRVLIHWACAKIDTAEDESDRELAESILAKLADFPGISFKDISRTAFHARRAKLATMLLEYEPKAADQVPILLGMKETDLALAKAIESRDTDLIYLTLLSMKNQLSPKESPNEFFRKIVDKPLACDLLVAYCKEQDPKLLTDFYYFLHWTDAAGAKLIREAYFARNWQERMAGLDFGLQFFQRDKQHAFAAQATKEQMELLQHERKMELELKEPFVDKPVNYIIARYIEHNQLKKAKQFKKKFGVPDKRFWHIHVRTLAQARAWSELEKLVHSVKKPPIGFLPIVEACVSNNNDNEAVKYIMRLPDPVEKLEWLCTLRRWQDAANVAADEKDYDCLTMIQAQCKNPGLERWISDVLAKAK